VPAPTPTPPPAPTPGSGHRAFRRPGAVGIVDPCELAHPGIPPGPVAGGGLEGLKILHLSDLHVRRWPPAGRRPARGRWPGILDALDGLNVDLAVITGDLMDEPGEEHAAVAAIEALAEVCRPRLGFFGVLGNHDTPALGRMLRARSGPPLFPACAVTDLDAFGVPLRIVTLDFPEDTLGAVLAIGERAGPPPFTLALAHMPTAVFPLADAGVPLVLAGHTHAGQVRLSPRLAPHTSSDIPVNLAAGVLRLGSTLCAVSRGIGDGVFEGLRLNCPPQIPLYTLRRGPLPGTGGESLVQAIAW
jgi:uncharacterized protein